MALFNFDVDFAKRRAEREAEEKLRRAREGFVSAIRAGEGLPVAPSPFLGVSAEGTDADLVQAVRNEEAARAAADARSGFEAGLTDATLGLQEVGIDPSKILTARDAELRRRTIEDMRRTGEIGGSEFLNALNKQDVSPFRLNSAGLVNRFTGDFRDTPATTALAQQRRMAALKEQAMAGSADALAELRELQAEDQRLRTTVVEDVLAEPAHPLIAADIANSKSVFQPERVKARLRDGSEVFMDAVPNQQGGVDYVPAASGAGPVAPTGDDGTALQKDTSFIAETLGIKPNEALLFKLQSARKAPEEAWADVVGRIISATPGGMHAIRGADLKTKAEQVWAVMRPGEPVPGTTPPSGGDPVVDEAADAQRRAEAEGFNSFGSWVPGQGLEVFDDTGKLVGHYF